MARLTGLFTRGPSYYLRVVLPKDHPLRRERPSGRIVFSLGPCDHREAVRRGTIERAALLSRTSTLPSGEKTVLAAPMPAAATVLAPPSAPQPQLVLRDVFDKWRDAKSRSDDAIGACRRALALFEEYTGNPPLTTLTRAQGDGFRAWLQRPERGTTSKTARDRMNWVKSLLKYAHRDLEVLGRHPWEGLDIEAKTTHKRRPWTNDELKLLMDQPLHRGYELPTAPKAGCEAAYWIPLLGMFTGARVSELAQLVVRDVQETAGFWCISINEDAAHQKVKTEAGVRKVPLHSELIRLGYLEYVAVTREAVGAVGSLWPRLKLRAGKPGGYFSAWFSEYRKALGIEPDFHCLRHSVRTQLAEADISEQDIDALLGHEIGGSTGAKVYTHRTVTRLKNAVERISYEVSLRKVFARSVSSE